MKIKVLLIIVIAVFMTGCVGQIQNDMYTSQTETQYVMDEEKIMEEMRLPEEEAYELYLYKRYIGNVNTKKIS